MSWFSDYFKELQNIEAGQFRPVYFLFGDDFYLKENFIHVLADSFKNRNGTIDKKIKYANELDASNLQNILYSISMFQKPQLIILNDIKKFKNPSKKLLKKYLGKPIKENILVLIAPEIDYRNKFLKDIKAKSTTLMITSPFENEIPAWIKNYLNNDDRKITNSAIDQLIKIVGTNLSDLSNELDKLKIYLNTEQTITDENVRFIAGYSKTNKINDLLESIGKRDKSEAIIILENLISKGFNDVYMLITLYNFIWGLSVLKDPRINDDISTGRIIHVYNTRQLNKMKGYTQNYSKAQLLQGINSIVEADKRIKTSQINSLNNIILVIENIMRKDQFE
ncbi:MAG: DNA polymerase III subunit delta [Candidatus Marinimicrobia bacterium]|nr:DNA polymerase III subunit delta [Candidatus Neomarinimicrobiota bacterium]